MIFYDYFVAGFIDIPFTFSAWLGLIISRSVLYPKNLLEQKSLWLEHEWISPADGWRTKRDFYRPVLTLLSVMWPNKSIMIRFRPCISCLREYNARYLFFVYPWFFVFFDTNFSNWLLRGEPTWHLFILVHKETGRRSGCRIFMSGS